MINGFWGSLLTAAVLLSVWYVPSASGNDKGALVRLVGFHSGQLPLYNADGKRTGDSIRSRDLKNVSLGRVVVVDGLDLIEIDHDGRLLRLRLMDARVDKACVASLSGDQDGNRVRAGASAANNGGCQ